MSIERCFTHDRNWDSDFHEECPLCRFAETLPSAAQGEGFKVGIGQSQGDGQAQRMNPSSDSQVCLEEAAKAQPTLKQEA